MTSYNDSFFRSFWQKQKEVTEVMAKLLTDELGLTFSIVWLFSVRHFSEKKLIRLLYKSSKMES